MFESLKALKREGGEDFITSVERKLTNLIPAEGYVYAELNQKDKEDISCWASSVLKEDDLVFTRVNGEVKGGIVVNDLHLTLSFGFDHEQLNMTQLQEYLKHIPVHTVKVAGVGMFPIEGYDCNALVLFINDGSILKKIHDDLSLFRHIENLQTFDYRPHLSIAYVRKDFDIRNVRYTGPDFLRVENVHYKLKSSPLNILSVVL